jgi:hypothetical protein
MIKWIIRYMFPTESETECVKCNHQGSCSAGLPNCATHSPIAKRSTVMSFHPVMKKFSRPLFDDTGRHPKPWQWALAGLLFIVLVSFTGAVK